MTTNKETNNESIIIFLKEACENNTKFFTKQANLEEDFTISSLDLDKMSIEISCPYRDKVPKVTINIDELVNVCNSGEEFKRVKDIAQFLKRKNHQNDADSFIWGIWKEINKRNTIDKSNKTDNMETDNSNNGSSRKKPATALNLILYGPPGTGKTYQTVNKALEIIEPTFLKENKENRPEIKKKFDRLVAEGRIVFTTFHQSMSYEDFVEGIKPETQNNGRVTYEVKPGIFKELCVKAERDKNNPYVLIIDEINRGNIANIFGELITLIEPDKRIGNAEALTVKLPYSHDDFGVPNNLYIIGTMNTADRSVEALDSALRRRFEFEEMMSKPELVDKSIDGISLKQLLETINQRLEVLKDREHQIGQSYFMKVIDLVGLKYVMYKNVIPLLQEYFYGDYEKIQMVLGDGFIEEKKNLLKDCNFPTNSYNNNDAKYYEIKNLRDKDFLGAIDTLLGKKKETQAAES